MPNGGILFGKFLKWVLTVKLPSGSQPVNKLCKSNCIYFTQNRHSNVKGKLSEVIKYKTKFFMQYKGKVFSLVIM